MNAPAVLRIALISNDARRLAEFYRDAFGFTPVSRDTITDDAARLLGADAAELTRLRLGGQTVDIVAVSPPGQPYPPDVAANDVRFQHFAIVVADMAAAYRHLRAVGGWHPISSGGPQRLPATSGGVTAFKFRDPEGHPLELLEFPAAAIPERWRVRGGACLGIDHSAITVTDTRRSAAFYRDCFGFSLAGTSLNQGPEQEHLDGVTAVVLDVTALRTGAPDSPGIELLCYSPTVRTSSISTPMSSLGPTDVASTRLVIELDDFDRGAAELARRHAMSGTVAALDGRRTVAARDPDGHHLILVAAQ